MNKDRYDYKELIKKFGMKTGIFLFYLMEKQRKNSMSGEWFHLSTREIERDLGLNSSQQKNRIVPLLRAGIIKKMISKGKKTVSRKIIIDYDKLNKIKTVPSRYRK